MTRVLFNSLIYAFKNGNQLINDGVDGFQISPIYQDVRSKPDVALLDILAYDGAVSMSPENFSSSTVCAVFTTPGFDGWLIQLSLTLNLKFVANDGGEFPRQVFGFYIYDVTGGRLVAYEVLPNPITFTNPDQLVYQLMPTMRFPASMVG